MESSKEQETLPGCFKICNSSIEEYKRRKNVKGKRKVEGNSSGKGWRKREPKGDAQKEWLEPTVESDFDPVSNNESWKDFSQNSMVKLVFQQNNSIHRMKDELVLNLNLKYQGIFKFLFMNKVTFKICVLMYKLRK